MIVRSIIGILHHRLVVMTALFSIYNTPTKHTTHEYVQVCPLSMLKAKKETEKS